MRFVFWFAGAFFMVLLLSLDAAGMAAQREGWPNFFWFHHVAGIADVFSIACFLAAYRRHQNRWARRTAVALMALGVFDLSARLYNIVANLPRKGQ